MAKEKSKTQVIIPCRLSYFYGWEPDEDDGKYSTQVLLDKSDTKTITKVKEAIKEAINANKSKLVNAKGKLPSNLKLPLHDGDEERDGDEYDNMLYFNASTTHKPSIFNRRREPITDRSEVYSGCYANVAVNFFAFNKGGNIGISAGLQAIQKVRDGEMLGGSSVGADDFEDLGDEEPDDFLDDELSADVQESSDDGGSDIDALLDF